ncbi:MAG: hypothetical protein CXT72_01395 [Methanobacteriota archaeon]|nr:MAG: hypothetical protein CXT72_01395 [Euryarchaeota archaeon]
MNTPFHKSILLASIVIFSSFSGLFFEIGTDELRNDSLKWNGEAKTSSLVDVPSWNINDIWNYNGNLDLVNYVASSGINTNLQSMSGTLQKTVTDIYTMTVDNKSTLVYNIQSHGEYDSGGAISLEGTDGCLFVTMDTEEIVRASDLASIEQEATFDLVFDPVFFGSCRTFLRQNVAELIVLNEYSPPLESYDFPLYVGDNWDEDFTQETSYSGSSNYVTIPSDTVDSNSTNWEVMSQGFSGVGYSGCIPSYNISSTNSDGEDTGYKWFCPAIRGDIKTETIEGIGFTAIHSLSSYNAVNRPKQIDVEVEFPLSPIDLDISAWVNVSQGGNPLSNQNVEFRYEIGGNIQTVTTAANGSAHIIFNTGHAADDSITTNDLGSHGIVAWIPSENLIGVATVTIDPDIHEIDLIAYTDGVTVERTRGIRTVSLNDDIGFNAIPGDILTFSIPVINRGLIKSPTTILEVTGTDGATSSANVPRLDSLAETRIEIDWVVPANQLSGYASILFEVDPGEVITNDGNRSNNQGSFTIFIGRLPEAVLLIPNEALTLDEIVFNGLSSWDPDGGSISCYFTIEKLNGDTIGSEEPDCIHEYSWDDDGIFLVTILVTDDESDTDYTESSVTILNRHPEITISTESDNVPVLSRVTFELTERIDLDTQHPQAPVDIQWKSPCEETEEGTYTVEVDAMDDDGAITTETYTVNVMNIAPFNSEVEVTFQGNRLQPNSYGLFTVNEGEELTIRGIAHDSENDIDSLQHIWTPDAENIPDLQFIQIGRESLITHRFETDGQHLATLQVIDDDGESAETLTVPFKVNNIAPTIRPFAEPLPAAEDNEIEISMMVDDTAHDLQIMTACFDINPDENTDSIGNKTDDCDVESLHLKQSWPDSNSAPDYITFHATDDDGGRAWVSIPIDIRNVKPTARATTSTYQPVSGESFVINANGTVDSVFDMQNMRYQWDLNIAKDSDGDGNPANDIDVEGSIIELVFNEEGTIIVQLTVNDGDASDSMILTIQVQKAPFSVVGLVSSPFFIIFIVSIIVGVGGFLFLQKKKEVYDIPLMSQLKKISMDDAFDDEGFDPFSEDKERRQVKSNRVVEKTVSEPIKEEKKTKVDYLTEIDVEQIESDGTEPNVASINEVLSAEDIEALFDEEE